MSGWTKKVENVTPPRACDGYTPNKSLSNFDAYLDRDVGGNLGMQHGLQVLLTQITTSILWSPTLTPLMESSDHTPSQDRTITPTQASKKRHSILVYKAN